MDFRGTMVWTKKRRLCKRGKNMIAMVSMIILFGILGVVFSLGKGSFLIAGFNTLPKKEKEQFYISAMCKFMGKMMFVFSLSVAFWVLSDYLQKPFLIRIGLAIFLGNIVFILAYMNTSNRFKNSKKD